MTVLSTLEVLRQARATLSDREVPFDFDVYQSCTCGHLYAAATGEAVGYFRSYHAARLLGVYGEVMADVARALGWDPSYAGDQVEYVSDLTYALAQNIAVEVARDHMCEEELPVTRSHALAVVEKAIGVIEAREEHQRLQVLSQMRDVVDALDMKQVIA